MYRADLAVIDSKGKLRRGTEGGRTRAMFHSLPGTGQRSAKLWWDLGFRRVSGGNSQGHSAYWVAALLNQGTGWHSASLWWDLGLRWH